MNVQDFTYLLQHPDKVVSPIQTKHLGDVLEEYPYFQAARALHLKGLKNLNSFKYNNALKLTAAYTTDRDVLFDFITSKDFFQNGLGNPISDRSSLPAGKETNKTERADMLIEESKDKPLPQSLDDADQILDPKLFKSKDPEKVGNEPKKEAGTTLEIGQPLPFTKKEKHSFAEWLQLTSLKTIDRKPESSPNRQKKNNEKNHFSSQEEILKKKKFQRIDKFISNKPKIVPQESLSVKVDVTESVKFDKNELMTETLAKVYLEQKKYKKAIQAYKILSLKYPEKSGFFADRIKAVEKLKADNP